MICDELSQEEIYQAYLIYASLHGLDTDEKLIRQRITAYLRDNIPDESIDEAIVAYAEDCIIAPPDVVVSKWGSSRIYELERSRHCIARHQTCESWFENGCRFTEDCLPPRMVHFWTMIEPTNDTGSSFPTRTLATLPAGTRLSLELESSASGQIVHRKWGVLGCLPVALANALHKPPLRDRKYLALIDGSDATSGSSFTPRPAAQQPEDTTSPAACKLLVISAAKEVPTNEVVEYAAEAFLADRNKC